MIQRSKQNLFLAVFVCIIACLSFAAAGACIKLISWQVPTPTILFCQNVVGFCLILPRVASKGWDSLKTEKWNLQLTRALLGLLTYFFLFKSLKTIPLVIGSLLNGSGPLWIPLLAWIWLKVRMDRHVWWAAVVGYVGVALILQPGLEILSFGSTLALCSGICAGLVFLVVEKLSATEPTYRTLFYYFLVGMVVMAPLAFWEFSIPSNETLLYLLSIGLLIFLGQMLLTYAFQHGRAAVIAPLAYIGVIYSGLFDWLIWNRVPNLLTCLGGALVITGAILAIYFERQYQRTT